MGLDISWYTKIRKVDYDGDEPDDDGLIRGCVNDDFPGRADEIDDDAVYAFESDGWFHAGTYGGYNRWRDQLAVLAGYESAEQVWRTRAEGPFFELIHFSDCEGDIGPATSKKLASDFAQYQEAADKVGGHFLDKYREWRAAFEAAADNGVVKFH